MTNPRLPAPLVSFLGFWPVLVVLFYRGLPAGLFIQLSVVVSICALFLAVFPRKERVWPAGFICAAFAVFSFTTVRDEWSTPVRSLGAIVSASLVLVAVGPSFLGPLRDITMALRYARGRRDAAVTHFGSTREGDQARQ